MTKTVDERLVRNIDLIEVQRTVYNDLIISVKNRIGMTWVNRRKNIVMDAGLKYYLCKYDADGLHIEPFVGHVGIRISREVWYNLKVQHYGPACLFGDNSVTEEAIGERVWLRICFRNFILCIGVDATPTGGYYLIWKKSGWLVPVMRQDARQVGDNGGGQVIYLPAKLSKCEILCGDLIIERVVAAWRRGLRAKVDDEMPESVHKENTEEPVYAVQLIGSQRVLIGNHIWIPEEFTVNRSMKRFYKSHMGSYAGTKYEAKTTREYAIECGWLKEMPEVRERVHKKKKGGKHKK